MTAERWAKLKSILSEARERDGEQRQAFLRDACGEDSELRQKIESLLGQGEAFSEDADPPQGLDLPLHEGINNGSPEGPEDTLSMIVPGGAFSPGEMIADRFEILSFIGRGGMGEVYKARDRHLGVVVALKTILPTLVYSSPMQERFKREILVARQVSHRNVCRVYDFAQDHTPHRNSLLFSMELLEGETLADHLKRKGRLSTDEALPLVEQMVAGLAALHEEGIVHRDFKPGNIFLSDAKSGQPQVKITDFGLARPVVPAEGGVNTISGSREIIGTPRYMAPEQLTGQTAGPSADTYALGLVMYEMVTGKRPYAAKSLVDSAFEKQAPPTSPSEHVEHLSSQWEETILHCLQPAPEDRPADVSDVVAAIEAKEAPQGPSRLSRPVRQSVPSGKDIAKDRDKLDPGTKPSRRIHIRLLAATTAVLILAVGLVATIAPTHYAQRWLATLWPTPLPSDIQLAMLPFALEGPEAPSREYVDGLIATVSERLADLYSQRLEFFVLPPALALRVRRTEATEAAQRLGANLVFTGALVSSEKNLRVNVDLFSADRGRVVRSESFEIARGDPVALRERLVTALAEMLALPLPAESQANPDEIATAYGYYVEALGYLLEENEIKSIDKAISLLRLAQAEDEEYGLAWAGLALAYMRKYELRREQRSFQLAQSAADAAIAFASDIPQAHISAGQVHLGSGRYEEAVANFGRALELDPGNPNALIGMGRAYEANKAIQEAEATFKKAIALRPKLWTGYKWLGLFYYTEGRYRDAIDQYKRILQLAPRNVHARLNLGGFHAYLGEFAEARRFWEEAVAIDPDPLVLGNLAKLAFDQGGYTEAVGRWEQVVELEPNLHLGWGNLAASYMKASRIDDSEGAYRTAIQRAEQELKVNAQNADAMAYLGHYHGALGEVEKAKSLTARAVALAPDEPHVLITAAETYALVGEPESAGRAAAKAVGRGYSLKLLQSSEKLRTFLDDPKWKAVIEAEALRQDAPDGRH